MTHEIFKRAPDIIIIDDPAHPTDMDDIATRTQMIAWWTGACLVKFQHREVPGNILPVLLP